MSARPQTTPGSAPPEASARRGGTARLEELAGERDAALRSLTDLDRERQRGEIGEPDYRALREEGTARAAAAIRTLEAAEAQAAQAAGDDKGTEAGAAGTGAAGTGAAGTGAGAGRPEENDAAGAPSEPAAAGRSSAGRSSAGHGGGRRSRRQRWSLAGALLCFAVVAGLLVGHYAGARQTGQTATGSVPGTSATRSSASGSSATGAGPRSAATARTITSELASARRLASQGQGVAAAKLFSRILRVQPQQPEALTYEGWLLRLGGVAAKDRRLEDQGRALVAEAMAADPGYPDAHLFLGYMLLQDEHDPTDAVAQFQEFLRDHPDQALVRRTASTVAQAFADVHQPVPSQVRAAAPAG